MKNVASQKILLKYMFSLSFHN